MIGLTMGDLLRIKYAMIFDIESHKEFIDEVEKRKEVLNKIEWELRHSCNAQQMTDDIEYLNKKGSENE